MASKQFLAIVEGPEFARVESQLSKEDSGLPHRAHDEIHDQAERLAEKAANRVRRLPIRGSSGRHTGLRQRVAAGVKVVGSRGQVAITTSMVERDEAIIPRGLDRRSGWRHPVFGNRSVWVRQRPFRSGWFTDTMQDGQSDIKDGLEDEIQQSAHRIAEQGH